MICKRLMAILFVVLFVALTGCADVQIYSDQALSKQTGIPVYGSKPYLLVSRTGKEDKPMTIEVVYVKDPTNVIYIKPVSGFGSNNLEMVLSNGQLTSYGQVTDTKIPELINSVSGLITARANAVKTQAEADQILASLRKTASEKSLTSVDPSIFEKVREVSKGIDYMLTEKHLEDLRSDEMKDVSSASSTLKAALDNFKDPKDPKQVRTLVAYVVTVLDKLAKLPTPTTYTQTKRDSSLAHNQQWVIRLKEFLAAFETMAEELPDFELYEIIVKDGATELRPVIPATL